MNRGQEKLQTRQQLLETTHTLNNKIIWKTKVNAIRTLLKAKGATI